MIYKAFNNRDIGTALSAMHPNIEWSRAFEGGYITGKEEIRNYWTRQWTEINPHVEPVACHTRDDGSLQVEVAQLVKDLDGNVIFNGRVNHVYTLEDGLLSRMNIE